VLVGCRREFAATSGDAEIAADHPIMRGRSS
jgi:hypothetical protein